MGYATFNASWSAADLSVLPHAWYFWAVATEEEGAAGSGGNANILTGSVVR
jgi:hypothetical protein